MAEREREGDAVVSPRRAKLLRAFCDERAVGVTRSRECCSKSGLESVSGLEHPPSGRETKQEEHHGHTSADLDAHVRYAVEAPAEAANQINHWVEQGDLLPNRREHLDRIEAAAEKGQWGDDQHRHELQLFEPV